MAASWGLQRRRDRRAGPRGGRGGRRPCRLPPPAATWRREWPAGRPRPTPSRSWACRRPRVLTSCASPAAGWPSPSTPIAAASADRMQAINIAYEEAMELVVARELHGAIADGSVAPAPPPSTAPPGAPAEAPASAPRPGGRPRVEHDDPSFVIEALPAEAFEALLVVAVLDRRGPRGRAALPPRGPPVRAGRVLVPPGAAAGGRRQHRHADRGRARGRGATRWRTSATSGWPTSTPSGGTRTRRRSGPPAPRRVGAAGRSAPGAGRRGAAALRRRSRTAQPRPTAGGGTATRVVEAAVVGGPQPRVQVAGVVRPRQVRDPAGRPARRASGAARPAGERPTRPPPARPRARGA